MVSKVSTPSIAILVAANIALTTIAAETHAQWPQWGGLNRDLKVETNGLSDN